MVNLARWLVAVSAVTALVYTTVPSLSAPNAGLGDASNDDAPGTCPAGAKQANLKFTVNDMNGQKVSLESFKGKVIVLTTTKEHAELKRDQIIAYGKDDLIKNCTGSMHSTRSHSRCNDPFRSSSEVTATSPWSAPGESATAGSPPR